MASEIDVPASPVSVAAQQVRPLTDRERAIRWLKSTAVAVSGLMFVWLLLWIVLYHPFQIELLAFYVSPDESAPPVLFQEADATAVKQAWMDQKAEDLEKWSGKPAKVAALDKLIAAEGSKKPCLVYLSAPAFGHTAATSTIGGLDLAHSSPKDTLAETVKRIAQTAKRPVLIALDAAQVGSDREFGVFANNPYEGLRKELEEIKSGEITGGPVYILTSCGPGQMSHRIDAKGRTIFSMALEEALEQKGSPRNVVEFCGIVREAVSSAVDKGRTQTPVLIEVGSGNKDPNLFKIKRPANAMEKVKKGERLAKAFSSRAQNAGAKVQKLQDAIEAPPDQKKKEPVDPPSNTDENDFEEMKNRLQKIRSALAEIRERPTAYRPDISLWKQVQLDLIKAQLRVLEFAKAEGKFKENLHGEVNTALKTAENRLCLASKGIPNKVFHPLRPSSGSLTSDNEQQEPSSPASNQEDIEATHLADWLAYFTAKKPAEVARSLKINYVAEKTTPNGIEKSDPSKEIPASLKDSVEGFRRSNSLMYPEQMLAIWAYIYEKDRPKQPEKAEKLDLLEAATAVRFNAEAALALAELWGGFDTIQESIKSGDHSRRELEDLVFLPSKDQAEFEGKHYSAKKSFKEGLDRVKNHRLLVHTVEQDLLELPLLAPVSIRKSLSSKESDGLQTIRPTLLGIQETLKRLDPTNKEPGSDDDSNLEKKLRQAAVKLRQEADESRIQETLSFYALGGKSEDRSFQSLLEKSKDIGVTARIQSNLERKQLEISESDALLGVEAISLAKLDLEFLKLISTEKGAFPLSEQITRIEKALQVENQNSMTADQRDDLEKSIADAWNKLSEKVGELVRSNSDGSQKIVLNPTVMMPTYAFNKIKSEQNQEMLRQSMPSDKELGDFKAERLRLDIGPTLTNFKINPEVITLSSSQTAGQDAYLTFQTDAGSTQATSSEILKRRAFLRISPEQDANSTQTLSIAVGDNKPKLPPFDGSIDLVTGQELNSIQLKVLASQVGAVDQKIMVAMFYRGQWSETEAKVTTNNEDLVAVSFTLDHNQLRTMEKRHTDESVGKTKADFDEKFAKKKEIHLRQGRPFYGLYTVKNLTDKPLHLFNRVVKQINATAPISPAELEEITLGPKKAKTIPVTLDPDDVPVTSSNHGRLHLKLFADKDGKAEITLKNNTILKEGIKTFQHPAREALRFEEAVYGKDDPIIPANIKVPGAKYSVLKTTRYKDDPVVDPFFPRDILCDVSVGPEGKEVFKRNEDLISIFNQGNKNKLNQDMLWPGDEISYYYTLRIPSLPEVFYRIRKLAEDKPAPTKPDEPLVSKDTPAVP